MQKPMLDLLHKNLDSKGKQAKLKSPQELQDLLDVTRQLLEEYDDPKLHSAETPEQKADLDEIREKFRIVRVRAYCLSSSRLVHWFLASTFVVWCVLTTVNRPPVSPADE